MNEHINFICKTLFFELRRISSLGHYLSVDATKPLVVVLSLLAGLPLSLTSKLQRVQNCASRLVVRASSRVHVTPGLKKLQWLPVRTRISYKIANICFDAVKYSTPAYLSDLLHLYCLSRSARSGELGKQKLKSHLLRTRKLKVLPLKSGVGQCMTIHTTLTARDTSLLISTFPAHFSVLFFFYFSPEVFLCWLWLTLVPVWARKIK